MYLFIFEIRSKGYFLSGQTNTNGGPFFGQLRIGPINLEEESTYEISCWAYMYCSTVNGCNTARDSITVVLDQNDPNNLLSIDLDYSNIGLLRVWEKKILRFNASRSILNVCGRFLI